MDGVRLPKRLLIRAHPEPEENLVGYILRLTELNGYETPTRILQLAKIQEYIARNFSFNFGNAVDLSLLSNLTGVDPTELLDLQYKQVEAQRTIRRYLFYGWAVPQPTLHMYHPKICPGCLGVSSHVHKIWDFVLVTACPIHKCLLIDVCPNCHNHISWVRSGISHCRCNYDWRDYSPATVEDPEIEISYQIYRLCNLLGGSSSSIKLSRNSPLCELGLPCLAGALIFIASQYTNLVKSRNERRIDTTGQYFAPLISNAEIHTLLCRAYVTFADWPINYYEFLEWRRMHRSGSGRVAGFGKDFKGYKYALYKQLSHKTFDFMRGAFEEFLISRWDGGYTKRIQMMGTVGECSRYITQEEAIRLLKTHHPVIRHLVETKELRAVVRTYQDSRMVLIERADVQALQRKVAEEASAPAAAALLDVSQKRLVDLVNHKLLITSSRQLNDNSRQQMFNIKEVEALLSNVEGKIVQPPPAAPVEVTNFLSACRILARDNVRTGQFVKGILDSRISPCGKAKQAGLQGLLFTKGEVREYAKR